MRKFRVPGSQYSEVLSVLQFYAMDKPFFPNLEVLRWESPTRELIPSIPLFLSPRTATVSIVFDGPNLPRAMIASMIASFPMLCPNLQEISLRSLPRDPMITTALSGSFFASQRNTLRCLTVDSPLTEEACKVIFNLPNLRELSVVIERDVPLPSVVLPNLANLTIDYDSNCDWLQGFRGATLGNLASVTFNSQSESVGDFLEAFESVALTTSTPATLSMFKFHTSRRWKPHYRSLLPFTQLKEITVDSPCLRGCSSTVDDGIINDIARAMPRLEILHLADPCQTPAGVTASGLAALAYYCLHLTSLRIHFQVASLQTPTVPGVPSNSVPTIPREDCALTHLNVGSTPLSKDSVLMVTLTLLRIFPRIKRITSPDYSSVGWRKADEAVSLSKQFIDRSSKRPSLTPPKTKLMTPPPGAKLESAI